jgi:GxxExxY protein
MSTELLYKNESFKIIGACFEVYNQLGSGFLESVYQQCLLDEFQTQGINCTAQQRIHITYKGKQIQQFFDADFICFDKITLEIKAVKNLLDEHRAQTINYLKATNLELALLVNFGHHPKLQYERFLNQN